MVYVGFGRAKTVSAQFTKRYYVCFFIGLIRGWKKRFQGGDSRIKVMNQCDLLSRRVAQ